MMGAFHVVYVVRWLWFLEQTCVFSHHAERPTPCDRELWNSRKNRRDGPGPRDAKRFAHLPTTGKICLGIVESPAVNNQSVAGIHSIPRTESRA